MTPGYRALAISITALLILTVVSFAASDPKQFSETHKLRHQCIDHCRSEATVCTTACGTEDCLETCTEPLASCIDTCRETYPRKAQ
jgi:hypothetical protein